MVALVKLVGILVVVMGAIYFVKPDVVKKVMHFWMKDNRLYLAGVLNVLVGIIFLLSASVCLIPWIVVIFGVLSLIKGILAFALGPKKVASFADQIVKKPVKTLRVFAVIALAIGVLLIYAA